MSWPLPPLEAERQVGGSQSKKARGSHDPRDGILHQIVSRLTVAIQVFLRSWTVDIHQDGCNQRSAPQRRHTAHVRRYSGDATRKPSSWDQGGDKTHHTPGTVHFPSTWSPELLGHGKGTK